MSHRRLHLLGITAIIILSAVDIAGESKATFSYFIPVVAVLPVVLTFCAAKYIKRGTYKGYLLWAVSYLNILLGIMAWAYYASNGTSDPSTAAHMHVVLFPMMNMVFGVFLVVVAYLAELVAKIILVK